MNRNKILLALLVIVLVFGILFIVFKKSSIPAYKIFLNKDLNKEVGIATMTTEKSSTDYLNVEMTYPASSTEKYPEIYSFVNKAKSEFMKQFDSLTPEDISMMHLGGDRKYDFNVTTKVATSTKTISYILSVYEFTGGAHGITAVGSFTYDKEGKFVPISDVLQGDYLGTLSTLSRKHFYDMLGDNAESSGTDPNEQNFNTWYLTDNDIVFIFGQYSVGPYAFGIQEYNIPKTDLNSFITEKYK